MLKAPNPLPSDPIELRVAAEGLVELAKEQALRIAKLEHQLKGHQRHRFGSKSESADQLNLRLEEEETADARATPPEVESEPQQKPKRKPLPPTLPRNEEVLIPGESCTCGGKLRVLGEDVTEELEYRPGQFVVNRIVRPRMEYFGQRSDWGWSWSGPPWAFSFCDWLLEGWIGSDCDPRNCPGVGGGSPRL